MYPTCCCGTEKERIIINIRGARWETYESTVSRYPGTLLGCKQERLKYFDPRFGEYYFDRSNRTFDAILFYYQSSGILSKPADIDDVEFQEDLEFFGIATSDGEICPVRETNNYAGLLWSSFNARPSLESPDGFVGSLCCGLVFFSVMVMCVNPASEHRAWELKTMQHFFSSVFAMEYVARVLCSSNRRNFLRSLIGLADMLAFVPLLLQLLLEHFQITQVGSILRTLQTLSVLKLARYSKSLKRLGKSLSQSSGQLCALLVFFFVNCLTFSCILHEVEYTRNKDFATVLDAMWFSIISMTTVGYGDVVPTTTAGKVFASISMVTGILTLLHLFLPVYTSYYSIMLTEEKMKRLIERKRKRALRASTKASMGPTQRVGPDNDAINKRPSFQESISKTSLTKTLNSMKFLGSLFDLPKIKYAFSSGTPIRSQTVTHRASHASHLKVEDDRCLPLPSAIHTSRPIVVV